VIFAWFRFRSSSIWPGVLVHAMADSGLAALAVLAPSHPGSQLIGGPIGLIGLVRLGAGDAPRRDRKAAPARADCLTRSGSNRDDGDPISSAGPVLTAQCGDSATTL
jgi:hypothetical protein